MDLLRAVGEGRPKQARGTKPQPPNFPAHARQAAPSKVLGHVIGIARWHVNRLSRNRAPATS